MDDDVNGRTSRAGLWRTSSRTGGRRPAGVPPPPAPVWAYAYLIEPALRQNGVGAIRNVLNAEHVIALREGRPWASRLVFSWRTTRILIVSDRPVPDGEVNRKLEIEISWLHAQFTITEPMAVLDAERGDGV